MAVYRRPALSSRVGIISAGVQDGTRSSRKLPSPFAILAVAPLPPSVFRGHHLVSLVWISELQVVRLWPLQPPGSQISDLDLHGNLGCPGSGELPRVSGCRQDRTWWVHSASMIQADSLFLGCHARTTLPIGVWTSLLCTGTRNHPALFIEAALRILSSVRPGQLL